MENKIIEVEMTSLEIAELTGKANKHVNETIRNKVLPSLEIGRDFDPSIFKVKTATYKDNRNRTQKMFILNKYAANALVSYYDFNFACKVIQRLDTLEKELLAKQEEIDIMKNIVWTVINGQNFVNQTQALKMAGVEHPNLFMRYLKDNSKFHDSLVYDRGYLVNKQVGKSGLDRCWRFTKEGFKWLLGNKDNINNWVQEQKEARKSFNF